MFTLFFALGILCTTAQAQPYAGTYMLQTDAGTMTLILQQDSYGDFIGTFVDDRNVRYEVEGMPQEQALGGLMTSQPSSSFSGAFSGNINGTPTSLTLQQQGTALNGQVDAGGYRYTLSGTVQGATATGQFADPQTGGAMPAELTLQGDQLTLTLMTQDPTTGQGSRIVGQFQRGAAVPQGPDNQNTPPAAGADANVERDPSIVGGWSYTESMTSGDASMVTQMFLQINPGGSYAYGNGRAVGGGAGWSGDTGQGGDVARGQWRTQNRVVYIKENGVGQWMPYARYYVEAGRMMFTFGDGSRQVWHRR